MRKRQIIPGVFRNKYYTYFFFGQSVSLMGTRMHLITFNWLLYQLTGSAFMLGLVNFVSLLPTAPITIWFGTISQRISKKLIMLVMEVALVAQTTFLFWLVWQGKATLVWVAILRLGIGLAAAIEEPIRMTFFYDIVGPENISEAVASYSSSASLTRVIGPALAGFIIAWKGEAFIFLVNALTFLPNIALLFWYSFVSQLPVADKPKGGDARNLKIKIEDGVRYIFSRDIFGWMFLSAIVSIFYLSYVTHMPVFVEESLGLGADTLGILMGAVGAGAVLGAFVISSVQTIKHRHLNTITLALIPIFLVFFSISRSMLLNSLAIVVVSGCVTIVNSLLNSFLQTQSAENFRGLVMSIFVLLRNGLLRFGGLLVGALAEYSGIAHAFAISALIGFVFQSVAIFLMRNKWFPAPVQESLLDQPDDSLQI